MTLRLVLIGIIVFVVVISFALDENSYSDRTRRNRSQSDAENEAAG